ncbi:MAG TPA: DUF1801 domain-containing protein [Blastocatellia bacterium]|nr:DUF1801 domain-containing protein [Blastocatellia bacterium]
MKNATAPTGQTRSGTRVNTVDDYLAAVPEDARAALAKLRKTIKAAAPKATEVISYQIPAYKHHGLLVGFAASKNHCTFHIMSVALTSAHAAELEGYKLGRASIRFEPNDPLPAALVTKLVKARIAENEAGRTYRNRK